MDINSDVKILHNAVEEYEQMMSINLISKTTFNNVDYQSFILFTF